MGHKGRDCLYCWRPPEQNQSKTMENKKKKKPTKCCLLICFRKRGSKAKVEPLAMSNMSYRGLGAENGSATPFINTGAPPMVYPPPQAVPGFTTPVPYPPPIFGESQPPQPYSGGMFRSAPLTHFPQIICPKCIMHASSLSYESNAK